MFLADLSSMGRDNGEKRRIISTWRRRRRRRFPRSDRSPRGTGHLDHRQGPVQRGLGPEGAWIKRNGGLQRRHISLRNTPHLASNVAGTASARYTPTIHLLSPPFPLPRPAARVLAEFTTDRRERHTCCSANGVTRTRRRDPANTHHRVYAAAPRAASLYSSLCRAGLERTVYRASIGSFVGSFLNVGS